MLRVSADRFFPSCDKRLTFEDPFSYLGTCVRVLSNFSREKKYCAGCTYGLYGERRMLKDHYECGFPHSYSRVGSRLFFAP